MISALLATLAACGLVFGFAEWRLSEAVRPVKEAVAEYKGDLRSLAGQVSSEIVEQKVRTAVLEERSRWMQATTDWRAEIDRTEH